MRKPNDPNDMFPFVYNGTCYKTFTQGFCSEGKYMQFFGTTDPHPKCYSAKSGPPQCLFGAGPVTGMPCEPGYKEVGDDCVLADIDFE